MPPRETKAAAPARRTATKSPAKESTRDKSRSVDEDAEDEDVDPSSQFNFLTPSALLKAKEPAEWLIENILCEEEQCMVYARAGAGKSLIVLEWAVDLALFGLGVLYLDAENSHGELFARLCAMGHCEEGDLAKVLTNLHYASFPDLRALDKPAGGAQVLAMAQQVKADVVIVDTSSRFVDGEQNSNDTHIQMARHTLRLLKGVGIASIVLDHPGKDINRGAAGGYHKITYLDVVWRMECVGDTLTFTREKTRTGKHPEKLMFERVARDEDGVLHHRPISTDTRVKSLDAALRQEAEIDAAVEALADHGVPKSGKGSGRDAIRKKYPNDERLKLSNELFGEVLRQYKAR